MYDKDHEFVRDYIRNLRWDLSDFKSVVLYTKLNVDAVLDEVLTLTKYSDVYVVFNYGTEFEYRAEL